MNDRTEARHPIRVVAQRTGLTPATLRAWERRYGVVEPQRSEGGQRLYSDTDVERLARLRQLTEAGRPISLVASLSDDEARALLAEDRRSGVEVPQAREGGTALGAERLVDEAFRLAREMAADELEAMLRRAAVTMGGEAFMDRVVTPFLHRVGEAWTRDELVPAEEHLATAVVERVLTWLSGPVAVNGDSPRLVVATLPNERHGLGAMLVSASAGLEGWSVTYLGTDLPPEEIANGAKRVGARAVAVSVVNSANTAGSTEALRTLREHLPRGVRVLVGGGAAAELDRDALPAGVEVPEGLQGLRQRLRALA